MDCLFLMFWQNIDFVSTLLIQLIVYKNCSPAIFFYQVDSHTTQRDTISISIPFLKVKHVSFHLSQLFRS